MENIDLTRPPFPDIVKEDLEGVASAMVNYGFRRDIPVTFIDQDGKSYNLHHYRNRMMTNVPED